MKHAPRRAIQIICGLAVALMVIIGLSPNVASPAQAATSSDYCVGAAANSCGAATPTEMYVYVKPGEKIYANLTKLQNSSAEGYRITGNIYKPNGDLAGAYTFPLVANAGSTYAILGAYGVTAGPTEGGLWKFVILVPTPHSNYTLYSWDWGVNNASNAHISGRTFTYALPHYLIGDINNFGLPSINFWAMSDLGYIYKTTLFDFNGAGSGFSVDSKGLVSKTTGLPTYTSGQSASGDYLRGTGTTFRIFFELPATDLPFQAPSMDGVKIVGPPLLDAANVVSTQPVYTPSFTDKAGGAIQTVFDTRFSGNFEIQIDTNDNGSFSDAVDVKLPGTTNGGAASVTWNGKDGQGSQLAAQAFAVKAVIPKYGEMHFIRDDVEKNGGIRIERLNGGDTANRFKIYWDDGPIWACYQVNNCYLSDGSRGAKINATYYIYGTAGIDSSLPYGAVSATQIHGWAGGVDSWGDNAWIDDWVYAAQNAPIGSTLSVSAADAIKRDSAVISIAKSADTPAKPKINEAIKANVTIDNTGNSALTNVIVSAEDGTSVTIATVAANSKTTVSVSRLVTQVDIDQLTDVSLNVTVLRTTAAAETLTWNGSVAWTPSFLPELTGVFTIGEAGDTNGSGLWEAGEVAQFNYTITNTGGVALKNVFVKFEGVNGTPPTLKVGESYTLTVNHTITAAEASSGAINGTATFGATDTGLSSSGVYSTTGIVSVGSPVYNMTLTRTANPAQQKFFSGDTVVFTYTVTNSSNVNISGISLKDDHGSVITCPKTAMVPGEVMTCTSDALITYGSD